MLTEAQQSRALEASVMQNAMLDRSAAGPGRTDSNVAAQGCGAAWNSAFQALNSEKQTSWLGQRPLTQTLVARMLSGVLVFNQKGENLIFRAFRNDCRPRLADVFRIQVISNAQVRSPILTLGSTTFSHIKHENIYLVAITKSNVNAALVFEFLYRLVQLGKGYFGKFDEEAVKSNFVLVYELLDGMLNTSGHLSSSPNAVQKSLTSATPRTWTQTR